MNETSEQINSFDFWKEYDLYKSDRGKSSPGIMSFFQDIVNNTMYAAVAYLEFVESEMSSPEEAQGVSLNRLGKFLSFINSIPIEIIDPNSINNLEVIKQRISSLVKEIEDLQKVINESDVLSKKAVDIRKDFDKINFINYSQYA